MPPVFDTFPVTGPATFAVSNPDGVVVSTGTATGNGTMDFSIATGDDTGLLALLEDI